MGKWEKYDGKKINTPRNKLLVILIKNNPPQIRQPSFD